MIDAGGVWCAVRGRISLPAAAFVAVAFFLVDTIGRWGLVAAGGSGLDPVGVAVVATAIVVGRAARFGGPVGLLAAGVLLGDGTGGVVWAVAAFVAATVAARLWARAADDRSAGWVGWTLRYEVVAVGAVFALAATSAWLFDTLGRAAFSVTVWRIAVTNLPLAVVAAPLVRPAVERADGSRWRTPSRPTTRRTRNIVVLTFLCWMVVGDAVSFTLRALGLVPRDVIGRRLSSAVQAFVSLWGSQGTYLLSILGVAALVIVVGSLFRN